MQDLPAVIKKIADFLEVKVTGAEVKELATYLDFFSFEKNEAVNQNIGKKFGVATEDAKFMRKGECVF